MTFSWHAASTGLVTCTEWGDWLSRDAQIDPYLVWADLTNFASFGGWRSVDDELHGGKLPILVEVTKETLAKPIAIAAKVPAEQCHPGTISASPVALALMDISGAYTRGAVDGELKLAARHFVARIAPANIPTLLLCREDVIRFQLGIPRLPASDLVPRDVDGVTAGKVSRVVVGVIDDGCAFAHPNFCSPGEVPRVRYLWDQDHARRPTATKSGEPGGSPGGWESPLGFLYGAELSYSALKAAVKTRDAGDELAPYRAVDYVPIRAEPHVNATQTGGAVPAGTMRRGTHGASVMDLAVGEHPPLAQQNATEATTAWPSEDSAKAWPVVFVQLPTRTVLDTSGGSLGVHVLDGIRYVLDRAVRIAPAQGDLANGGPLGEPAAPEVIAGKVVQKSWPNRVVINISYGAIAGPHDGTSILEGAMEEIALDAGIPCWIVVAAGNAHQSRSHARLRLQRGGGVAGQFTWRIGPDNPLESYLEIWLPAQDDLGHKLSDDVAQKFLVTVYPPGGASPRTVDCGQAAVLRRDASTESRALAGIVYARKVSQGNRGTMILLAVRRTAAPLAGSIESSDDPDAAPHGDWLVSVSWAPTETAQPRHALVHAWAERNDLLFGNLRRQQSTVVDDQPVPDPTEFSPDVRDFCERRARWVTDQTPRPFQPENSLGTLAGVAPARDGFWANWPPVFNNAGVKRRHGATVVVGAYRLADGEMAAYSSGGPGRGTGADSSRHTGGLCHPAARDDIDATKQRIAPDIDAPGDVGVALRGLRTAGLLPGSSARISGTSAAAPTVTRMIANAQYQEATKPDTAIVTIVRKQDEALPATTPPAQRPWRATPTPTKDDWFRRGRRRVPG